MKTKYDIGDCIEQLTEQKVRDDLVARMRERRKEQKLTQQALAQKSGVSYATLRRFETQGDISFASLLKIANALDCLEEFNLLFCKEKITNLRDY